MLLQVYVEDSHNGSREFLGFFETAHQVMEAIREDLDDRLSTGHECGVTWSVWSEDEEEEVVNLAWDEPGQYFDAAPLEHLGTRRAFPSI